MDGLPRSRLGTCCLHNADDDRIRSQRHIAIGANQKAVSIPGGKVYLAHVYAVSGQRSKALDILNELKGNQEHFHATDVLLVYAGLGERDQAFAWLEKAFENRDGVMVLLKVWPLLDPLRSDPRFATLTQRAGLPL